MDKRELILNTMRELFEEGTAGTASVSDIAKRAGIAKGGLYYYFHSKEEVLDALVNREYETIIKGCETALAQSSGTAPEKLALLLHTYTTAYVDPSLNEYLHMPQNAALHQKSLATILLALSPMLSEILVQGTREGSFICHYPLEYSEILLSVFTFLMDSGIFSWTMEQRFMKMKALALMLEKGLCAAPGCFDFLFRT